LLCGKLSRSKEHYKNEENGFHSIPFEKSVDKKKQWIIISLMQIKLSDYNL
jgi:hypothetical protein